MLKQGTFIRKKFTSLLICSLWGALAVGLNYMLDSVLGGNQLGEDALTAISIVTPLYFITNFLILLLAPGYGMIYGKYNGAFENEKSYEVAGQSIISSIGTGLIILIFLLILKEPYLRYYECTGKIYEYASIYYKWTIYSTAPAPIALSLFYLILEDADTLVMTLSGAVKMVINAILSILLCKPLGIAGLGLATFLGGVAALLVLLSHFFKKTCSIHFRFYFNWGMLKEALTLSSSIFFSYLFIGLVDIIMNKVILVYCGLSMIAAYSVINLAFSCYEIYDCIYYSCGGFIATFLGEKNSLGIKTTLKVSIKATCILGLCLSAILLIIAPYIPDLYGMTTPDVIDASIISAKIMALASIPYGIAYAAICTFPALGRAKSGFLISVLNDLICPLLLSIPLCILTGFNGVAIGMALSSYLVWIIFALVEIKKIWKTRFSIIS